MALADFVGNEPVVQFLRRVTERERIAHAWLFSGPARVGKRTLAMEWAKLVNCQAPLSTPEGQDACDQCPSCRRLNPEQPSYAQTHPAIRWVDTWMAAYWEAAERRREGEEPDWTKLKPKLSLGIDVIRTLREWLSHRTLWRYQVVIIDEAERLTEEASAALLKLLEEPADRTLFILVSANPWAIHPTIRSRCQPLRFRLVPSSVIYQALRQRGASEEVAMLLTRLARGRIGWALHALRSQEWQQNREQLRSLLELMLKMTWWDIFRFAEQCVKGMEETEGEGDSPLSTQRRQLEELLEGLLLCWRDMVAAAFQANELIVNADWHEMFARASLRPEQAIAMVQQLRWTLRHLRPPFNANPQLALELLAASLVQDALQSTNVGG